MLFVDNYADFITVALSTATCFVYTNKAYFCAKRYMAELHTRFRNGESIG